MQALDLGPPGPYRQRFQDPTPPTSRKLPLASGPASHTTGQAPAPAQKQACSSLKTSLTHQWALTSPRTTSALKPAGAGPSPTTSRPAPDLGQLGPSPTYQQAKTSFRTPQTLQPAVSRTSPTLQWSDTSSGTPGPSSQTPGPSSACQ